MDFITKLELLAAFVSIFFMAVYGYFLADAKKSVKPTEPGPKKDEK